MKNWMKASFASVGLGLVVACTQGAGEDVAQNELAMSSSSSSGAPCPDSGVPDSGQPDSGQPDSGQPDSGQPDSGPMCTISAYGGRAFTASAALLNMNPLLLNDTGNLPAIGGQLVAGGTIGLPPILTLGLANATVNGAGDNTTSESTLANAGLSIGLPLGLPNLGLTADVISATSVARCSGVTGSSTIANLRVNGGLIDVSGAPNQVVNVLNVLGLSATLTINEQIDTSAGNVHDLTVNALHLRVIQDAIVGPDITIADVVLASADASVTCACSQ